MTHNYTTAVTAALLFLFLGTGCASDSKEKCRDSVAVSGQPAQTAKNDSAPVNNAPAPEIAVAVFDVPAGNGQPKGFGYDILVNGKKTVHQPMIPAVQGNKSFATEQEAKAVGELAAARMRKTGDLPTINIKDLDSLKITY